MVETNRILREISNKDLETWLSASNYGHLFGPHIVNALSATLLSERKERENNPGAWDGAPEWATHAAVQWHDNNGHELWRDKPYTRTLPKTKAREIAERKAVEYGFQPDACVADCIEAAILEAQKDGEKPCSSCGSADDVTCEECRNRAVKR